jgi:peptidoglycan/LPS O-acetylase OafA/YrhL
MIAQTEVLQPKKHYQILDGLRGVAAIFVVVFHTLEAFSMGNRFELLLNHGYLAVDFFFLLSGFVVAYAYDDRWEKLTTLEFLKRRLIRLQPMVIIGMIIGALLFYQSAGATFPPIAKTAVWQLMLTMLVGFTVIPVLPSMDIRGWQEMHPLNGPAWSLFFEYIGNILYALFIRKFSKTALSVLVFITAGLLIHYTIFGSQGDVIGGWSVTPEQLKIGFTRLLFPFFAGILLSRFGKLITIKGGFWICAVLLVTVLSIPRLGGPEKIWMNGLYESIVIILIFPLIVSIGAGSSINSGTTKKISKFLGDISYPIYITHYPLIYVYTAWVIDNKVSLKEGIPMGLLLIAVSIVIAYLSLKFYDEPVRNWLQKRFLKKNS